MPEELRDRLDAYRKKRSASRTTEPFGVVAASAPVSSTGGRLFVLQKHSATNLHWDLRLESDGVLLSWAVPKGPSPNPADKRLAVHVEDHPLDYAEFEGVIPEGEYGAGPVIVWDKGVWVPLEDPHEGLRKGKLLFELRGYKVRGKWTLVKTKQSENSWLFIKERDGYVRDVGTESYPDDSIYSGLLVDQVASVADRTGELAERAQAAGARRGRVDPRKVKVMLATAQDDPFVRENWVFEIKFDGYRMVAGREGSGTVLVSRSGGDFTGAFPEVTRALQGLPYDGLVLDGEVVIHDDRGLPSFDRLQRRGLLTKRPDIARAALELPATYYAFDLLGFGDLDLRPVPLLERKALLRDLLPTIGPIRFSDHIAEQGTAMYEQVSAMGLEGVVAKRADARYRSGRSSDWIKIRALDTDDFVIVGWTEPKGSRTGFGALHLAQHTDDGTLTYVGSVGTGFTDRLLDDIRARLGPLEQEERAFQGEVQDGRTGPRTHHWISPELVCEVRYRELTEQGLLRHPVFMRLREDKAPADCRASGDEDIRAGTEPVAPTPAMVSAETHEVPFTNLDKVFWPESGHTKGDLIEYYRVISPWLLPYLRDRPVVLTRFPDGIDGKSFFQKNVPEWAPDWVRTTTLWSEDSEEDREFFVCDDLESLLYVVNLGTIPLHIWSSRVSSLSRPDWCVLDLDPKDAPFEHVVGIARHIKRLCNDIDLPAFPKTSGSTGLHVLIPLGRVCTHEQSRTLAELLARVVAAELPEIATVVRNPREREGRVYVDFVQNGHGRLIVAPFSVRPVPEAAVSAPLRWSEIDRHLTARTHTIETLPGRMETLGKDPLSPVLELTSDLATVLAALAERLQKTFSD